MADQQQTAIPVSEREQELIKRTFGGNEVLLQSIRALFLGLGVSGEEKKLIKATFSSKEVLAIMWKRLLPSLDKSTPIGEVADVWMGAEQMVFGVSQDAIRQALLYKEKSIELTKHALILLENPDGVAIDVNYSPAQDDALGIVLLGRNQFIRHVETQLTLIKIIAEQPMAPKSVAGSGKINRDSAK